MISRPRPLEENANNKAKNDHAEITIVAITHGNYSIFDLTDGDCSDL